MAESIEPRALTAALAAPAFSTKVGSRVMHAATRHAERWAPETNASNVRSLRSLGFVDRLVAPWIEAAQRSASLRLFSQYRNEGMPERPTTQTSWLFPRPWYQDELDWMAAARQASADQQQEINAPTMLTTRGTYVPSEARSAMAMPAALYEYVAPSLSIAQPKAAQMPTMSTMSPSSSAAMLRDVYSPLVPVQAAHAAQFVQRAISPMFGAPDNQAAIARMSPGLRAVLSTMLERTAISAEPTRLAGIAPELVTPPAPRADAPQQLAPTTFVDSEQATASAPTSVASQTAIELHAQRVQLVELQRAARVVAERELAARIETARAAAPTTTSSSAASSSTASSLSSSSSVAPTPTSARNDEVEARIAQRLVERQQEQHAAHVAAERTRIERTVVAQREQRLHEAARESAARDARAAAVAEAVATTSTSRPSASSASVASSQPMPRALPAELVSAMASLSPALATTVAASLARQPDRAVQTIGELHDALRAAELIARTTASGGSFESVRGPRLVMPAGLGGLVATVEHSSSNATATRMPRAFSPTQPTPTSSPTTTAMSPLSASTTATAARAHTRVPTMTWMAPQGAPMSSSSPAALAAAEASRPAALQHVAWADRWLARFSGARAESLDVLSASSSPMAMSALATNAPAAVFVAPMLPRAVAPEQPVVAASSSPSSPADVPVQRFDDNAETPDDVFASIAAAARTARTTRPSSLTTSAAAASSSPAAAVEPANVGLERVTFADAIAHAAPAAPHAGLSAQLASSPFAPAFRHVLPLAAAPTFDVRALFGNNLVASYLAGVLASSTDELSIAAREPGWLSASLASVASVLAAAPSEAASTEIERRALEWEPSYVAPAGEPASVEPTAPAPTEAAAAIAEQLTTIRSALLALDVEIAATGEQMRVDVASPRTIDSSVTTSPSVARSMAMAMALPMVGELATIGDAVGVAHAGGVATPGTSYAAPGMIADRAQAWSVAQERSASDLAFDFVTPELVLAARVYGLGPAEAAQAARLAIAGPGGLATMASTVDRTFVQAFAIEAERRAQAKAVTAYPTTSPESSTTASSPSPTPMSMAAAASSQAQMFASLPTSTFGVDRRAPRGAFMWPPATVAALGLTAASPDGEQSMSVAALELLAAQAVAELGTYAAFSPEREDAAASASTTESSSDTASTTSTTTSTSMPVTSAEAAIRASEPSDADVLAAATAIVPTTRRAKLEAMYVALGQSHATRSWSPAARAARALALAGRGDDTITPYERASMAWDVLPVVAPMLGGASTLAADGSISFDELAPGATRSTGSKVSAMRAVQAQMAAKQGVNISLPDYVEMRPGLAGLSARAGEALGSYVAPAAAPSQPSSSSSSSSNPRELGAMRRVPTAAQEMVRTGRPSGRFGGGEVEIPTWFEAAARKMFDEKSSGGPASELSLAELTLITTAPSNQIAASTRGMPSNVPSNPNPSSQGAGTKDKPIDIEKVANDVYRHILVMMDAARTRNGEPYL
jgi:hypothetical protein